MKFTQFAQVIDVSQFLINEKDNCINVRVKDPELFDQMSFRTTKLTEGISANIGRMKGTENTKVQAISFDKSKYTPETADAWVKRHHGKFDQALLFDNQRNALFDNEYDISKEDVPNVLEEHIMYHLPPLKPSGVKKILMACGLLNEDMLDYTLGDNVPDQPENSSLEPLGEEDILKMTPEQMNERLAKLDKYLAQFY